MSDVRTENRRGSLYDQVCHILETRRDTEETAEEFKVRAAKGFNNFSNEEFDLLSDGVKMWIAETSKTMASNIGRQRPRALPGLPGLDATLQRFDISKPLPQKSVGRRRVRGEDAVTRVMTVMARMRDPEAAKVEEIRDRVYERFQVHYSDSAIKQAANAFYIARSVLGVDQQQAAE
jgi:hypothetical protein